MKADVPSYINNPSNPSCPAEMVLSFAATSLSLSREDSCGRAGPQGWMRDSPALPAPAGPPGHPRRPRHRPGWAPGHPRPRRPPAEAGSNTLDPCPLPEASAVPTWLLPIPPPPSRTVLSPRSLHRGDTEAHGGPQGSNQTGCPRAGSGHCPEAGR